MYSAEAHYTVIKSIKLTVYKRNTFGYVEIIFQTYQIILDSSNYKWSWNLQVETTNKWRHQKASELQEKWNKWITLAARTDEGHSLEQLCDFPTVTTAQQLCKITFGLLGEENTWRPNRHRWGKVSFYSRLTQSLNWLSEWLIMKTFDWILSTFTLLEFWNGKPTSRLYKQSRGGLPKGQRDRKSKGRTTQWGSSPCKSMETMATIPLLGQRSDKSQTSLPCVFTVPSTLCPAILHVFPPSSLFAWIV